MNNGQRILSNEEKSPGQGSQFSGSQVGDDLLSWRKCGSRVEITEQSKESPLILETREREQRDEALKHCRSMLRAL